ncbi:unnamed protein product, partial [Hymenolepis diminuta]
VEYTDTLLKKSFGFINIEPVLNTPSKLIKTDIPQINQSLVKNDYQSPTDHFQLDVLLNIREGRNLHLTSGNLQNSFLVVRIPWCIEEVLGGDRISRKTKRFLSAVSWGTGTTPTYHFGLRASAILSEDQITRLSKGFIAIEVWTRHMNSGSEKDELVGLAKVMTSRISTLYRLISSQNEYRYSRLPFLQDDSWLEVVSPSTGQVCGLLRGRFASGTPAQISALIDTDCKNAAVGRFDWRSIDFILWKEPGSFVKSEDDEFKKSENLLTITVTHSLNIGLIKLIDFHPQLSEILRKELGPSAFPSSDCDCFLQYRIPVDKQNQSSVFRSPICQLMPPPSHKDALETVHHTEESINEIKDEDALNGYEGAWQDRNNEGYHESHKHLFSMELVREQDILKNIKEIGSNAFLDYLRKDGFSQEDGIVFELWLRIYSPKLRDICVAQGKLLWNILEHHLFPPSSLSDVNKIVNFPPHWKRELSQHSVELYDVSAYKLLGRMLLNVGYEMTSTVKYSLDLSGDKVREKPICNLLPLTISPGIHLNVSLHNLAGIGVSRPLQIRMHCLLLLPPETCHSQYKVLASDVLESFISTPDSENKDKFDMKLDVLLPLAWSYESLFKGRCSPRLLEVEGFAEFSLAEALAHGAVEINDRQSWLVGNVSRPCLGIQIDVWDTDSNLDKSHQENQDWKRDRIWGIDYNIGDGLILRPPGQCSLIATCRFHLSDLLNAGSIGSRWIPLLQVSSTSKSSESQPSESPLVQFPYRLGGAIKISANFETNSFQRNILEDIISMASPRAIQSLRELGFNLNSWRSAPRILGSVIHFDSLNDLRELSLLFTSIRLPVESALLNTFELATYKECGLHCCFFIRAILGSHIQISSTYSLPKATNSRGFGVVQFQDTLTLKNDLVSDSKKSVLEIQVWTNWLSNNNKENLHSKFANHSRLLGLLQIPLSHLFRNQLSSDSEEVFYWCSRSNDLPWNPIFNSSCIPVYPLVQSSSSSLGNECWIAFRAERSLAKIENEINEVISEEGVLVWYAEGHLQPTSSKISRSVIHITETFPAYVVIERANRLSIESTVEDNETLETFATFVVADMNPPTRNAQRIVTIPPVLDRIKPIWNYCRYALLPCSYINNDSKGLTVDVWQRVQGDQRKSHLGRATVPLSTLMLPKSSTKSSSPGLEFVKGWYEIHDAQGNSKGQILVGIYPIGDKEEDPMNSQLSPRLENLLNSDKTVEIEENHTERRVTNQNEVSVSNQFPFKPISSPLIFENRPITSPVSWELDPGLQTTNTSLLLNSLQSKLEELDIQNARLKQKLSHLTHSGLKDASDIPNLPVEVQDNSPVKNFHSPSPLNVSDPEESDDCIIYPFNDTDNDCRLTISSPKSSCTYQPAAFEESQVNDCQKKV